MYIYIIYIYMYILFYKNKINKKEAIIVAVTEGLVREEQLLHDMCLLGAMTVEITQILTRAR
jgi:hypothetical protein